MDIRTENLTILFVDIAGFTATTSRQSRAENAHLLQTFERTLLPLIKRFKGNVVKSIGDALLLTFRSPTDAMLCSMALQDAMHAHNLNAPDAEKIHIRVAANLGEVRVTKKDIFGEPVNVASRIEGVAPADEIYLSEAVYMAMNKAEVPAQEVGFKELAGITQPVRIYSIPRFATHRLIPQNIQPPEQGSELLFPYGGMHQRAPRPQSSSRLHSSPALNRLAMPAFILLVVAGLGWAGYAWLRSAAENNRNAEPVAANTPVEATKTNTVTATEPAPATSNSDSTVAPAKAPAENKLVETAPTPAASVNPAPTATNNTGNSATKTKSDTTANKVASTNKSANTKVANTDNKQLVTAKAEPAPAPTKTPSPVVWNVTSAKAAYRAGQISKPEYKQIVVKLEETYENRIRELKLAYRAQKISRAEYENFVREAKLAYNGR
ncbi:hypothetical protein HPT27_03000 [Permianibacter sp. IMCC34836]|uniref:adenylate/guanylate cyclase domain-containing protein n=1 Tax=Permianibacter fluminis TaxID=2738515 RepID=UPI0015567B34|nr:adenylate/guanylate cyclase domain-containing protein [Permianibacter fluminis]NQD35975.1 hypothetical protein [Permianibacter fluminis]